MTDLPGITYSSTVKLTKSNHLHRLHRRMQHKLLHPGRDDNPETRLEA